MGIKETIIKDGKPVLREKSLTKCLEDIKKLLIVKDRLEVEQRLIKKNLRKTNDEIKHLNAWLVQQPTRS